MLKWARKCHETWTLHNQPQAAEKCWENIIWAEDIILYFAYLCTYTYIHVIAINKRRGDEFEVT